VDKKLSGVSQQQMLQVLWRQKVSKEMISLWRRNLAFMPDNVILKTLAATSQLVPSVDSVEAEQQLVPQKHLVS
jgi:hypothetical protein